MTHQEKERENSKEGKQSNENSQGQTTYSKTQF